MHLLQLFLRIFGNCEGREGDLTKRSRSFQCQTGEVHAPIGDFAGMLSFVFFSVVIGIHAALNFMLVWVSIIFFF